MRGAAGAGRRESELARARLGERDDVGDRTRRQRRRDRHDQRELRQQDDRRKILHRIVGQVRIEMRADAVGRDRVEQQRVAVGVRLGDARGRRRAAGAAAIDDDDGLAERIGELGADHPRDEVGGAARRHRDDELDLPGRIGGLRMQPHSSRQAPRQPVEDLGELRRDASPHCRPTPSGEIARSH